MVLLNWSYNINIMDKSESKPDQNSNQAWPKLMALLKPYYSWIILLILLAVVSNGLNLILPKIIANGIDAYSNQQLDLKGIIINFSLASLGIFVFTYLQSIVQTVASEKVARDLRSQLVNHISRQSFAVIITETPAKLLTNLTADIDSVKMFVSLAIVSIVSSIFIIIGASTLMIITDWQLAVAVLSVVPIIGITFFFVFGKIRQLFLKAREILDHLNQTINESILGAAIIRVLNSQLAESDKFSLVNTGAKELGLQIMRLFATMIPIIMFISNLATLIILALGGHYVISGHLSLGNFTAFTSYVNILIFPILIIGFMSNIIAQSVASYERITTVLERPLPEAAGQLTGSFEGNLKLNHVNVVYGEKSVLKDVSFSVKTGTKTAIIGPTGAGKTQLLYLLTGLIEPSSGLIEYNGHPINEYDPVFLHHQIGLVFQDSILFNTSLRENISFSRKTKAKDLKLAIDTAELTDFIKSLPNGLDTIVTERGSSLSGGQKQRIMLARALAINPRLLLLDDFTARVDSRTEAKILQNISANYPDITLISVTQKINPIKDFNQIILLMEGDILAQGRHQELLKSSPEYIQIYNSQQSTSNYEQTSH